MAFWSDADWKRPGNDGAAQGAALVSPFDAEFAKHADYTLSVGREVYLSSGDEKKAIKKLGDEEDFIISPGQFCFMITQEVVKLNLSQLGFISIRASKKFYGLVNISGFHVDPGYSGRLIFSAFNAGPTAIHVKQGDRIFSLWISELTSPATSLPKSGYMAIPAELVNKVSGEFLTAYQLREKISQAEEKIKSLEDSRRIFRMWGVIALAIIGFYFKDALISASTQLKDWALTSSSQASAGTQAGTTSSADGQDAVTTP